MMTNKEELEELLRLTIQEKRKLEAIRVMSSELCSVDGIEVHRQVTEGIRIQEYNIPKLENLLKKA